jgi:transcription termination factor Rho
MPTSSSSSSSAEEVKPKARSKATAKAAPKKKKKSTRKKKVDGAPELFHDDDFGDGVDSSAAVEKPKKKVAKKKESATKKEPATRPRKKREIVDSGVIPVFEDSPIDDATSVMAEARAARFGEDGPDLSDIGDYFSASSDDFEPAPKAGNPGGRSGEAVASGSGAASGNSEEGGDGEGDRPRRRRRRRRRGGEAREGSTNTAGATNNTPNNTPNNTSNNSNSGGDNSGGRDRGRGRQQQSGDRDNRNGARGSDRGGRQPSGGAGRGSDRGGRGRGGQDRGGQDRGGQDRGGRSQAPRRGRTIQPTGEPIEGPFEGVLEMHPKGYGFLRDPKKNYAAEDNNPFVSSSVVEKYRLRAGVLVKGDVGPGTRNQGPRLQDVELIDGYTLEEYEKIKHFDELTPINPHEQIKLEIGKTPVTMRVMDLLCPIGKGQRALLVAPPRTGKTMLLQDIANSVTENHPEIHLIVLLIDERPEEVTEMTRSVKGEVIASSLDNDVESHVRIAELIIERGKRLAEEGQDVFILLDSITRLARAYNKYVNPSGRTGRGGLDIRALDIPKKLFGAARLFDEGGSLTVCGTALIDTNNGMDEAIFQEFKGTGNMEMMLSRDLADRRIWPSIDITRSGTRREEKILAPESLEGITMLRRSLISLTPVDAMEQLTKTLDKFDTNKEFLSRIKAIL